MRLGLVSLLLSVASVIWLPVLPLRAGVVDWEVLPVPVVDRNPDTVDVAPDGTIWMAARKLYWYMPHELLFRSADGGDTWTTVTVRGRGATDEQVGPASLAADPDGTVWLGTEVGLYHYNPASDIWTTMTVPTWAARVKRLFDGHVYASGSGLFRYDSGAGAWAPMAGGGWDSDITATPGGVLYMADELAKVSTDGGGSWQTLFRLWGPPNLLSFGAASFAGASPAGSVFVANQFGFTFPPHFYRLPPGGQAWEPLLVGINPWSSVVSSADGILACSLQTPSEVLNVYVSVDDGAHWTPLPCVLGDPSVGGPGYSSSMTALAMGADGTIYAGFQGHLARFRTGGAYALTTQAAPGGTIGEVPSGTFYTAGSTVTLTAMPSGAYVFTGWEGDTGLTTGTAATTNPLVIVMDRHRFVRAHFSLGTFAVTVKAGPGGLATRQPDLATYDRGSTVTLTAWPNFAYRFSRWTGDVPPGRSLENPLVLTVDTTRTLTGQFGLDGSSWLLLR